jgi:hypothetical protein
MSRTWKIEFKDTVLSSNLQELSENNNSPPAWSEQADSVHVTFLPAILPSAQQVTPTSDKSSVK